MQERRRGGEPAPGLSATGGSLQLEGYLLVGGRRCGGEMPGPAVGIELSIGGLRQRQVHHPALFASRRSVDRGADQRMTEPHRLLDREQPIHVGVGRADLDPESLRCMPEEERVAGRLGGGDQQQASVTIRNRRETALETLLEPRRQRLPRSVEQTEAARELRHRQSPRQLQQRERVASSLRHDPIADAVVESKRDGRTEKRACVCVTEPENLQLGESGEIGCGDARGEQQPDGLREKPPSHERENPRRYLVQPMRVVDDTEQRTLVCRLREQGQDCQPHEESIRRGAFVQAECNLQGVALRRRESLYGFEQRRAELVQGRERKLHLGLHARGAKEPHVRGRRHDVVQKRCLPDAGIAVKHQRAAFAGADGRDDAVEQGALRSAPAQRRVPDGGEVGHGMVDLSKAGEATAPVSSVVDRSSKAFGPRPIARGPGNRRCLPPFERPCSSRRR